jgi:hypothetical protein
MEDNLTFLEKSKTTLIFLEHGKQPQFLGKLEENINLLASPSFS